MLIDLNLLVSWLLQYRYALLFPVAVFEGPLITVLSGFLISMGQLDGPLVLLMVIIADLVGDGLYYAFGRWGGLYLFNRWGKYFGIASDKVLDLENHFTDHPGKTLIIGKLSHGIGVVALVAAGVARMNFWKFLWYNFLPSIPKSFVLMMLGFYFGAVYTRVIGYLDYLALVMVILGIVIVVALIFFSRRLRNKTESQKSL